MCQLKRWYGQLFCITKGQMYQALTRGDGTMGIDVTNKVDTILGSKIKDISFTGAVRGEICMTPSNF